MSLDGKTDFTINSPGFDQSVSQSAVLQVLVLNR